MLILFLFKMVVIIYDQTGNRGTVTEMAGFDPEADVQKLREAMKGAGE